MLYVTATIFCSVRVTQCIFLRHARHESSLVTTGGSLFNLLDDPENNFGLDEDEWLLVLSHLSAGMNHLRDNNLVHR